MTSSGAIDCTWAEFEAAVEDSLVIEQSLDQVVVKQLVLVEHWARPLHVVVIVDDARGEERVLTIYEPDPQRWSDDYRRRR